MVLRSSCLVALWRRWHMAERWKVFFLIQNYFLFCTNVCRVLFSNLRICHERSSTVIHLQITVRKLCGCLLVNFYSFHVPFFFFFSYCVYCCAFELLHRVCRFASRWLVFEGNVLVPAHLIHFVILSFLYASYICFAFTDHMPSVVLLCNAHSEGFQSTQIYKKITMQFTVMTCPWIIF